VWASEGQEEEEKPHWLLQLHGVYYPALLVGSGEGKRCGDGVFLGSLESKKLFAGRPSKLLGKKVAGGGGEGVPR